MRVMILRKEKEVFEKQALKLINLLRFLSCIIIISEQLAVVVYRNSLIKMAKRRKTQQV